MNILYSLNLRSKRMPKKTNKKELILNGARKGKNKKKK
jgi:hypothetical protein